MIDNPFYLLIDKCIKKSVSETEGTVISGTEVPFSVPVMDAGFYFNTLAVAAIQEYASKQGINEPISHISILTAMNAVQDASQVKGKNDTALHIIRRKDGKLSALFLVGCSIEENI